MINISLRKELDHLKTLGNIYKEGVTESTESEYQEDLEECLMTIRRSSLEVGRLTKRERVALRRLQERHVAIITVKLTQGDDVEDEEKEEFDAVKINEFDVILARIADVEDRMKAGDTTMRMPC